jgi:ubiquinone/menaquinone biosynthesis C-methylase UbiE
MALADIPTTFRSLVYDLAMVPPDAVGLRRQRIRITAAASGRVLEIGIGTGRNLPYYTEVASVTGLDPEPRMLERARRRSRSLPFVAEFTQGVAEDLPFPDGQFDTVVVSLALCTIPDPAMALSEIGRVLVPGGSLVFLEHVRSPRRVLGALHDRLTPLWRRLSGGCHLDRTTVDEIVEAGFEITDLWRSKGGSLVQGSARLAEPLRHHVAGSSPRVADR